MPSSFSSLKLGNFLDVAAATTLSSALPSVVNLSSFSFLRVFEFLMFFPEPRVELIAGGGSRLLNPYLWKEIFIFWKV
jgi:hypothetical protein